jgi:hypothetical protein
LRVGEEELSLEKSDQEKTTKALRRQATRLLPSPSREREETGFTFKAAVI